MSEEKDPVDVEGLARSVLGTSAVLRTMTFSSGAVTLDIWVGDDFATVQGVPSRAEWGVSVNPSPDGGFGTHDRHFATVEEALEEVRRAIGER